MHATAMPTASLAGRVAQDFFTHSGHVPVVLMILEALIAGPAYFAEPDAWLLLASGLGQAFVAQSRFGQSRTGHALANLAGPALYTLFEAALEGRGFFLQPHHIAYWLFAAGFTVLQALPARALPVLAENLLRAAIPLVMYALFEAQADNAPLSARAFFADSAHTFLAIVLLLLGLLLGLADLALRRSMQTIASLTERLRQYSRWALGGPLLERAIADEAVLSQRRVQRAVVFMDIRGFTAWSERQAPEAVVSMLDRYYAAAEAAAQPHEPVKIKFTADEVMAVFAQPAQAVDAAGAMLHSAHAVLAGSGLDAGAGVHAGPLVEGVLGGEGHRAYDFIGDTVNTAKRLCDAAGKGELLASRAACDAAGRTAIASRSVSAKGKREPLDAALLQA